jgi:hypothetical protein
MWRRKEKKVEFIVREDQIEPNDWRLAESVLGKYKPDDFEPRSNGNNGGGFNPHPRLGGAKAFFLALLSTAMGAVSGLGVAWYLYPDMPYYHNNLLIWLTLVFAISGLGLYLLFRGKESPPSAASCKPYFRFGWQNIKFYFGERGILALTDKIEFRVPWTDIKAASDFQSAAGAAIHLECSELGGILILPMRFFNVGDPKTAARVKSDGNSSQINEGALREFIKKRIGPRAQF